MATVRSRERAHYAPMPLYSLPEHTMDWFQGLHGSVAGCMCTVKCIRLMGDGQQAWHLWLVARLLFTIGRQPKHNQRDATTTTSTTTTLAHHDVTMAGTTGKENIADGLTANTSFKSPSGLSPKKSSRKTRSKSIGPGGLGELEVPALKESSGNRRKVLSPRACNFG